MRMLFTLVNLLVGSSFAFSADYMADIRKMLSVPIKEFEAETPTNCKSQKLVEAWTLALYTGSQATGSLRIEIARTSAAASLDVPDAALRKGCLDEADHYYREVIKIYTGTMFSAERQRAQIGIDDVRSARKR